MPKFTKKHVIEVKVTADNRQIKQAFKDIVEKYCDPKPRISPQALIMLTQFYMDEKPDVGFGIKDIDRTAQELRKLEYINKNMTGITTSGIGRIQRHLRGY
jgi:hypothetical protein